MHGSIKVWDLRELKEDCSINHDGDVSRIWFGPETNQFVYALSGESLLIWDLDGEEQIGKQQLPDRNCIAVSANGRHIALGKLDATVDVWTIGEDNSYVRGLELWGHEADPVDLAFSSDGHLLLSATGDGIVKVWNVDPGDNLATVGGRGLAVSPDSARVAVARDSGVRIWDLPLDQPAIELISGLTLGGLSQGELPPLPVSFSDNGELLATLDHTGSLAIWDVKSSNLTRPFANPVEEVTYIAFVQRSSTLVVGDVAGYVYTLDLVTGTTSARQKAHSGRVNCVAISTDGNLFATAGDDQIINLWDFADSGFTLRSKLNADASSTLGLAFSPDGSMLASASGDTIVTWSINGVKQLNRFHGHSDDVYCVAFSPDGRALASGSRDKTIRLWDPNTGQQRVELGGQEEAVYSLAFSADGRMLLSVGRSGVRLWESAQANKAAQINREELDKLRTTIRDQRRELPFSPFSLEHTGGLFAN